MIPILFELGPFKLYSFGLTVALALLVGVRVLERSLLVRSMDPAIAERYVFAAGISGLLGARLWYLIGEWESVRHDIWSAVFSGAGFTFYGGFIVAALTLVLLCRRDRISVGSLADALAPALAIGYAIGRLGCQLSGDGDYGRATSSYLLGMSYSQGVVPTPPGVFVFPTPLYESFLAVLLFLFLRRLETSEISKSRASGYFFGLYLMLSAPQRFAVEFLRINRALWWNLSEAQWVSIGLMVVGSLLYFGRSRLNSAS